MQKTGAVVNDVHAPPNARQTDQRHPNWHEQPPLAVAPEAVGSDRPDRPQMSWRSAVLIVLGFWGLWFLSQSAFNLITAPEDVAKYAWPRALVSGTGAAISLAIAIVLSRLRSAKLSRRAIVSIVLALVATALHGLITRQIWMIFAPGEQPKSSAWVFYSTDFLWRFWVFASQSAIILAQSYAADIRDREQRIISLQALAHSAQLNALRNQLSPHFLFNSLNSIAGLISAKRVADAETMTENLADFLRQTLALDPQQLITLDEEIQLQSLYLDIEKARFPDRLKVTVDVPADLRAVLVPSLITQPLVENSIKYAVSRSTGAVQLQIVARRLGDQLEVVIRDDGGDAEPCLSKGARLGLRNVSERVRMHYGDSGRFQGRPDPEGGFCNALTIPLETRS